MLFPSVRRKYHVREVDASLEDFAYDVEQWVSAPNQITFHELVRSVEDLEDEGAEFRKPQFNVAYRGFGLKAADLKALDSGKPLEVQAGSWTYDEDEAIGFAKPYAERSLVGVVAKRNIKAKDVLVDLTKVADALEGTLEPSTIDQINNEQEVLLKSTSIKAADLVWRSDRN